MTVHHINTSNRNKQQARWTSSSMRLNVRFANMLTVIMPTCEC